MQIWTKIEECKLASEVQEVATGLSGVSQMGCCKTPSDG
jgi:hypothetical protein